MLQKQRTQFEAQLTAAATEHIALVTTVQQQVEAVSRSVQQLAAEQEDFANELGQTKARLTSTSQSCSQLTADQQVLGQTLKELQAALATTEESTTQQRTRLETFQEHVSEQLEEFQASLKVQTLLFEEQKSFLKFFAKGEVEKALAEMKDASNFDRFEVDLDGQPALDAKLFVLESRIRAAEGNQPIKAETTRAEAPRMPTSDRAETAKTSRRRNLKIFERFRKATGSPIPKVSVSTDSAQPPKVISRIVSRPHIQEKPHLPFGSRSAARLKEFRRIT